MFLFIYLGSSASSKALVHDLDLLLVSPSGKQYFGNMGASADNVNVNEQIVVQSPVTGVWIVKVKSTSLPYSGVQKFSIAISAGGSVK